MKNIFIYFTVIALMTLSSCNTKDDNPPVQPTNSAKATINGVLVNFDKFIVVKKDYPADGYSDLEITATSSTDATKEIKFNVTYLATDNGACYYLYYRNDDLYYNYDFYDEIADTFSVSVTENVANKIKGTFNGTIPNSDNVSEQVTIINGSFDIKY